jgi:hypothetical protein
MSVSEVFHRITSALGEAGIAYMLAGSFASAYYGALRTVPCGRPKTLISSLQLPRINCEHSSNFSRRISTMWTWMRRSMLASTNPYSNWLTVDMATGWKIDLIIKLVNLQGSPLFVASAEDVVAAEGGHHWGSRFVALQSIERLRRIDMRSNPWSTS